jgi:hypothetical protein
MATPAQGASISTPSGEATAPADAASGGPKRPSRLGLTLAGCLLAGLLLWRQAVPDASPWLDLAALTAAWLFLLAVRALRRR